MKNLQVYLFFNGNCRDAMNFYKDALNGEIVSMQTVGETQPEHEDQKDKIMHSEFRSENMYFMASDNLMGPVRNSPGMVSLTIDLTDEKEQETIFQNLAAGGQVTMPLQDTFWGARFGCVIDKFGIEWMLNCNKPQAQ